MKISGPCHKRYLVALYLADDIAECPLSDRLSIPLVWLFGDATVAANDRIAAARVWFDQVGRFRQQRLEALGTQHTIREVDSDPRSVANQLSPSTLCPDAGGYLLDNGVEVWLISVRQVL